MIRIRLAVFLLSLLMVFSGSASGWQQKVQNQAPPHAPCYGMDDAADDEPPTAVDDYADDLSNAVEREDIEDLKELLAKGGNVNWHYGSTFPLLKAARKNNPEMIEAFLAAGANPNAQDCMGRTSLVMAILTNTPVLEMPRHTGVVMALLEHGASVTIKCDKGWTPLIYAAWFGNTTDLRLMLDKADLNSQDVQGRTALMWAAAQGHEEIVRALLDKGADAQLEDSEGQTAAMLADDNDQVAVVHLFKKWETTKPSHK